MRVDVGRTAVSVASWLISYAARPPFSALTTRAHTKPEISILTSSGAVGMIHHSRSSDEPPHLAPPLGIRCDYAYVVGSQLDQVRCWDIALATL